MDRSLAAKLDFLRAFSQRLLSLSPRFEPWVPGYRMSLTESMSLLGSLEKVAAQSLAKETPPAASPAQEEVITKIEDLSPPHRAATITPPPPPMPPAPVSTPSVTPSYSRSARKEYRPALGNPSIVEALVELQARAQAPGRRSALIKVKGPRPSAGSPGPGPTVASTGSNPIEPPKFSAKDFLMPEVPEVHADPKPDSSFRRPSTATQSILRTPGRP